MRTRYQVQSKTNVTITMEEDTQQQSNNNRPWLFKKGQSGNPGGRPKGTKSLKTYAQEMISSMTDEQRQEYLDGLPKQFVWEMAEGKAQNNTDFTSKGDKINTIDPKIMAISKDFEEQIKKGL